MTAKIPGDVLFKAFQVKKTGLIRMLPDGGDAILALGQRRFIISSNVLSAASPRLGALFPSVSVSYNNLTWLFPEVELPDADSYALWIILAVIHHHKIDLIARHQPTPKQLLSIAIQCTKFDCVKPLSAWTNTWQQVSMKKLPSSTTAFTNADADRNHKDYAYSLVAAHYFQNAANFKEMSKIAILSLPISFINHWSSPQMKDITQHLPASLVYNLAARIKEMEEAMNAEIKKAYADLKTIIAPYAMDYKWCTSCGTVHPAKEDERDPCSNPCLQWKYCTLESRANEFKVAFEDFGLWRPMGNDPMFSISDIVSLVMLSILFQEHSCSAASSCPLKRAFKKLRPSFETFCSSVSGFELSPLH